MKFSLIFFITILSINIYGQKNQFPGTDLYIRNIGPANPGGRVVDIEAHSDDFTKVYVASASGGVWKSTNAGFIIF